ncbi:DUF2255 family protein [Stenotrophomonas maltophilia]|nr:DUF2255 family protein [Stenotrophomonas maltophilia]
MSWQADELKQIVDTDDLKISPYRADGTTPGTPTWIWCVAVDGELYVRAYSGKASTWFKAAISQGAGQIVTGGEIKNVAFEPVEASINDKIDDAYTT